MQEQQNNPDKTKADQTNPVAGLAKKSSPKKRGKKVLKITGLVILAAVIYLVLFINGKPTIDTDYLAQLNKLNKPANYKEEDNAWPYYQKAFELFKYPREAGDSNEIIFSMTPKKFSDLNEPEQKIVLNWIELNQAAWQELVKATQKSYCYTEYKVQQTDTDKDNPFNEYAPKINAPTLSIVYPDLGDLNMLAFLGQKRIEAEIENGNVEQAVTDCFVLLSTSSQWQHNKFLMEQFVSRGFDSLGCQGLLKILAKNQLSSNQLYTIQERLTKIHRLNSNSFDLDSDRIMFLDIVQSMFTKEVIGGGHIIPRYIASLAPMTFIGSILGGGPPIKQTFQEQIQFVIMALLHARRNDTIAKYNQIFEQIQDIQKKTPYEIKQSNTKIDILHPALFRYEINPKTFFKESRFLIVGAITPWVDDNFSRSIFEDKAMYEAIITILALKRYKLEIGDYPETLDELLSKGYITSIPMDPFSDKPLVYKKTSTDFTLYSFGEDFKDDGGTRSTNSSRNIVTWGGRSTDKQGCDAVFWPVSIQ